MSDCIKFRLSCSDLQLIRDIIFRRGSHGWEKFVEEGSDIATIDRLVERVAAPLEDAQVDTDVGILRICCEIHCPLFT